MWDFGTSPKSPPLIKLAFEKRKCHKVLNPLTNGYTGLPSFYKGLSHSGGDINCFSGDRIPHADHL
jgi:hypothetical protein